MEPWILSIIGVSVLAILTVVFVVISRLKKKITPKEKKYYRQKLKEILNEKDLRHSILTADKLLEKILRRKGYTGTLGNMLKKGQNEFSDLNGVWYAHKIRNKLAHELDFKLSSQEAQKGLKFFQKAFKDLGAI